ncbi:hypothetical protein DFP72DRAFT_1082443 [Ephemerocybe angulata]|uniref:Uncharacterized protein n=1 Tax=Ephemerocybe angulata TaxID=980116 RepID=A0A8H6LV13_9AGAR|nr:hypothetical protein DFP72DRAFT_1082443 [Tulosesus angulatus]
MTPTVSAQPWQDLDDSRNDTTLYRGHRTGTRVPNNSGLTGSDYRNGNNDGALNKDTIPPPEPGESGVRRKWRLPSEHRASVAPLPILSRIPLLERRSGWNDWITAVVASLEEINLSGFVLDAHDLPSSNSPWKQPIYRNSVAGLSTDEGRVACRVWGQLDAVARDVITTRLARDVYRKAGRFLTATSDEPTSRDWFTALKIWYNYESGRAAWKVAEELVCGTDVSTYLTEYRRLIQDVHDSAFCVSPTIMLTTLLFHLPSLCHLHTRLGFGTPSIQPAGMAMAVSDSIGPDEPTFDDVLRWIKQAEEWFGSGVALGIVDAGRDPSIVFDGGNDTIIEDNESISTNNPALGTLDIISPSSHVSDDDVGVVPWSTHLSTPETYTISFGSAVASVSSTAVSLEASAVTKSWGDTRNGALLAPEDTIAGMDDAVVFDGGKDTTIEGYDSIGTSNLPPSTLSVSSRAVVSQALHPSTYFPACPVPDPSSHCRKVPLSTPLPDGPTPTMADSGWDTVAGLQMVVGPDPLVSRLEGDTGGDAPLCLEECTAGCDDGLAVFDGEDRVTDIVEDRGITTKAPDLSTSAVSVSTPDIRNTPPAGITVAASGTSLSGPSPHSSPTPRSPTVPLPNSSMTCRFLIVVNSGHLVVDRRLRPSRTLAPSIGFANRASPISNGHSSYEARRVCAKGV